MFNYNNSDLTRKINTLKSKISGNTYFPNCFR